MYLVPTERVEVTPQSLDVDRPVWRQSYAIYTQTRPFHGVYLICNSSDVVDTAQHVACMRACHQRCLLTQ